MHQSTECAQDLLLAGVEDGHALESVAEAFLDVASQVVEVDRNGLAANLDQGLESDLDQRATAHRQERLGTYRGQRAQSSTEAGSEDHGSEPTTAQDDGERSFRRANEVEKSDDGPYTVEVVGDVELLVG